MGNSNYVSAKYIEGTVKITVQITMKKFCDHVKSICWECADSWAIDYELNPVSTTAARFISQKLNRISPDKPLMNGEMGWRKVPKVDLTKKETV